MIRYTYRWDLDKTYLETDIDSVRGMLRSALEPAHHKRAVPGATALIRALRQEREGAIPQIVILSGSPTQMRKTLEQKLRLDGVQYDVFILKDNLANLKRGRWSAIRGQFGYKLPRLLEGRIGMEAKIRESLFGDDAEVDAMVYAVYADAIAGRISPVEVSKILERERAYPDHIVDVLAALRRVERADPVDRIFIHLAKGRPPEDFAALGTRVIPIRSWLQAALVLYGSQEIQWEGFLNVLETSQMGPTDVQDQLSDILKRGHVPEGTLTRLAAETHPASYAAILSSLTPALYHPPAPAERLDYLEFLKNFKR